MPKLFEKGRKKTGGRVKGQPNNATVELKQLLNNMLPPKRLEKLWNKGLNSKDEHIATKTFEMALHYMYGKPVQPIVGEEFAPPVNINISAIPKFRVKAHEQS